MYYFLPFIFIDNQSYSMTLCTIFLKVEWGVNPTIQKQIRNLSKEHAWSQLLILTTILDGQSQLSILLTSPICASWDIALTYISSVDLKGQLAGRSIAKPQTSRYIYWKNCWSLWLYLSMEKQTNKNEQWNERERERERERQRERDREFWRECISLNLKWITTIKTVYIG